MDLRWNLILSLEGPFGECYRMCLPLAENVASDIAKIQPLDIFTMRLGPNAPSPFEQTVQVLKRKEFRKDLLMHEAQRLGQLLAERMADAEGWHDASSIDSAKEQLSGRHNRGRAG